MLSKDEIGSRIANYRKLNGLTQTQLADMVFVSPQAVSSWEVGNSSPSIDILIKLSNIFRCTINDLVEEKVLFERILTANYERRDGIYYFSADKEYDPSWAGSLKKGAVIEKNWHNFPDGVIRRKIGQAIAASKGMVLEMGVGPGGGFTKNVLSINPTCSIILSDLSPTVIKEWKHFFKQRNDYPNLCYAVLNYCSMPFYDESIDVVSDAGSIVNTIQGTRKKAYEEAARVLSENGLFITSGGFITHKEEEKLPASLRERLHNDFPESLEDNLDVLSEIGFVHIETLYAAGWSTRNDNSKISDLARQFHSEINFTSYVKFCSKHYTQYT